MTDSLLTDDAVLATLGRRLAHERVRRELTQERLAAEAGVARTTVERIETGKSVTLANLVRVLRVLGLLDALLQIVPEPSLRPVDLARGAGRERKRASRRRASDDASPARSPQPFAWGDER